MKIKIDMGFLFGFISFLLNNYVFDLLYIVVFFILDIRNFKIIKNKNYNFS